MLISSSTTVSLRGKTVAPPSSASDRYKKTVAIRLVPASVVVSQDQLMSGCLFQNKKRRKFWYRIYFQKQCVHGPLVELKEVVVGVIELARVVFHDLKTIKPEKKKVRY